MARRLYMNKLSKETKKIVEIYAITDLDAHALVVLQEALELYDSVDSDDPKLDQDKLQALADLQQIVGDMIGEIGEESYGPIHSTSDR